MKGKKRMWVVRGGKMEVRMVKGVMKGGVVKRGGVWRMEMEVEEKGGEVVEVGWVMGRVGGKMRGVDEEGCGKGKKVNGWVVGVRMGGGGL